MSPASSTDDTTDVVVRRARPSDLRRLAPLERQAGERFRETFGAERAAPLFAHVPVDGSERDATGILLTAAVDRRVVGFVHVVDLDGAGLEAHLEQVSVLPEFGRRGIGAALVRAVMEEARWAGFVSMSLTTFRDVAFNGPFYVSLGFEEVTEPGPDLRRVRERERTAGIDDVGPRVVMNRTLNRPVTG